MSVDLALFTKDELVTELINRRDGCPIVVCWTSRDTDGDRLPMLAYSASPIHEVMGLAEFARARINIGYTNAVAAAHDQMNDDDEESD